MTSPPPQGNLRARLIVPSIENLVPLKRVLMRLPVPARCVSRSGPLSAIITHPGQWSSPWCLAHDVCFGARRRASHQLRLSSDIPMEPRPPHAGSKYSVFILGHRPRCIASGRSKNGACRLGPRTEATKVQCLSRTLGIRAEPCTDTPASLAQCLCRED